MSNAASSLRRLIPWERIARHRVRGHIERFLSSRGSLTASAHETRIELNRPSGPAARIPLRQSDSDLFVFHQVFVRAEYAPLLSLLQSRGETGSIQTIIDAGANVGCTSIYLGMHCPQARIIAIEPDPATFTALERTLAANTTWLNAHPMRAALWHSETTLRLDHNFRDGKSWSTRVMPGQATQSDGTPATTLGRLRQDLNGAPIDILKIDIEGAEHALMAEPGFVEQLAAVRYLAMEVHEDLGPIEPILDRLVAAGFQYVIAAETVFAFRERG
jgi:FkbM family methyltransferase